MMKSVALKPIQVTGLIYAQDSMEGQARMIGSLQSIGLDDRLLAKLPAKLDEYRVWPTSKLSVKNTWSETT